MWRKYLLSGMAAVFILVNTVGVAHAAQMTDGVQPVNEAAAVWEQDADAKMSETAQEDTYETARSTSGTYKPYEGAKYSLNYEVTDEGVVITGIVDYESKEDLGRLEIPAKIDGVKVTGIGDYAFNGCSGLTGSLTIPESVTGIGSWAFGACRGLTGSLTIPGSVTSIGESAFNSCFGLTGLTIHEGVTSIGDYAFIYCSGLRGSLTIPESVTSIGKFSFYQCSGLTGSLTIPESVESIGNDAFYSCFGLTSLTIHEGVTSIGDYAFIYCSGLTGSLTIPKSVTSIGKGAFKGCNFSLTYGHTYNVQGLVERFYTELLGREGEEGGVTYWTNALETGDQSAMLAGYNYINSDEFRELNLSNDEYLERLYKTFMNRPSDEEGKAYWLERLNAGFTRDYVYLNFAVLNEFTEICEKCGIKRGEIYEVEKLQAASEAYINQDIKILRYVTRCYTKILNRPADAEGVEYWCRQIITKAMEAREAAEFYVLSAEFMSKNTTDEQYIEVMYQTFFGRAGDEAGAGYWLGQISSNAMTREDVLHAFSATPEFTDPEALQPKPLGCFVCFCGYTLDIYTEGDSATDDAFDAHLAEHGAYGRYSIHVY